MNSAQSLLFRLAPLLALLAIAWGWPQPAHAQVKRCTTNSGATIYTDRPCKSVGAVDRVPRGQHIGLTSARRSGCARNLQDLIYEITAATDQRDVNRLGAVYHWVGVSPQAGDRILDRLQAIVDRPLVDIVAIRSTRRYAPEPIADAAPASPDAPSSPEGFASSETPVAAPVPRRAVSGGPVALRLEQTLRNTATPSRTILGLRRHYDCWWVVLPP
jgi:hypothetical protein